MLRDIEATLASFMLLGQLDQEEALIAVSELLRGKENMFNLEAHSMENNDEQS